MIKITGTSSYIKAVFDDKVVKISGEMVVGGFLAYSDTIKNWEAPYDDVEITDEYKSKIIKTIIDQTKNSEFIIEFE
jgi:hypothetical protein